SLLFLVATAEGKEIEVRTSRSTDSLEIRRGDDVSVSWGVDRAVIVPNSENSETETDLSTKQLLTAK
ncbi:MAG TPA: hypothetical protein VLZ31_07720, partial [Microbacteriaceae bacterium]|nr:hypothetical protein [Microbacteriaceae bacterium]